MPVATQGTVKSLSPDDLRAAGAQIVLANTYHLFLRPGPRRSCASSAACIASWPGTGRSSPTPAASRSSASPSSGKLGEDGVEFRSPRRRLAHVPLARERASRSSSALGVGHHASARRVPGLSRPRARQTERSLALTLRWAAALGGRARPGRRARRSSASSRADPIPTLRAGARWTRRCALDFAGYAIGGLAVGRAQAADVRPHRAGAPALLPADRPRYLMGVGKPADLVECGRARRGPVRLRAAHAQRAQRPGASRRTVRSRISRRASRAIPRRSTPDCRVRGVPPLLARLPAPPVHGARAPRLPPALAAQPAPSIWGSWPPCVRPSRRAPSRHSGLGFSPDMG